MYTFKTLLSGIILLPVPFLALMVTVSRSRSGVGRASDMGVGCEWSRGAGWSSPGGRGIKGTSSRGRRPSPL